MRFPYRGRAHCHPFAIISASLRHCSKKDERVDVGLVDPGVVVDVVSCPLVVGVVFTVVDADGVDSELGGPAVVWDLNSPVNPRKTIYHLPLVTCQN